MSLLRRLVDWTTGSTARTADDPAAQRARIDRAIEKERVRAERDAHRQAERDAEIAANARWSSDRILREGERIEAAKLAVHGRRFHCHICGKRSVKSGWKWYHDDEPQNGTSSEGQEPDWSVPGDLQTCSVCGKWTCDEDIIYRGSCRRH